MKPLQVELFRIFIDIIMVLKPILQLHYIYYYQGAYQNIWSFLKWRVTQYDIKINIFDAIWSKKLKYKTNSTKTKRNSRRIDT